MLHYPTNATRKTKSFLLPAIAYFCCWAVARGAGVTPASKVGRTGGLVPIMPGLSSLKTRSFSAPSKSPDFLLQLVDPGCKQRLVAGLMTWLIPALRDGGGELLTPMPGWGA